MGHGRFTGTSSTRTGECRCCSPCLCVPPNKRLKLAGPAFRGSVRLCTSLQIPQHGALAPALVPAPSPRVRPRSWVWQRWGLISGVTGFGLLVVEAVVADSASRLLASVLLGLAIGLMAVGLALIALGPRRDRLRRL